MCYYTYGSHLTHMTNDIKIDLKSKDLPITALAYRSPSLLGLFLIFITFWVLLLFASLFTYSFLKHVREEGQRSIKYSEVYNQELDRCKLENPYNGRIIFDPMGNETKRYPFVNCFALARYNVKTKYGLSPH